MAAHRTRNRKIQKSVLIVGLVGLVSTLGLVSFIGFNYANSHQKLSATSDTRTAQTAPASETGLEAEDVTPIKSEADLATVTKQLDSMQGELDSLESADALLNELDIVIN